MLPTTPPLPPLDNSQYPTQMDCFNDYPSFYPTSSAREEFDVYPFPDQTTVTEETSHQEQYSQEQYSTFPGCWEALEQPAPTVGLPTTLPAAAGHESLLPVNSWTTNQPDGYSQPSSSSYRWPEVGQETQSYYPGSLTQEYSFPRAMAFEPPTVDQTLNSDPLNCWGESQSRQSANTFHTENLFTHHQPGTSATRTGLMSAGRYQPYGRFRVRQSEHRNAEAGPSTLVPPPIPYVDLPTLQPSGGVTSETTADAEKQQPTTGEDEASAESKPTKRPRGKGPPRAYRVKMERHNAMLHDWAQRRLGLREAPVHNEALAEAVSVISASRSPVYAEHRLRTGQGEPTATDSKHAKREYERREVERGSFQELSRYYLLKQGQTSWTRPSLLARVMEDLEGAPPPPGPSDQPPP